MNAYADVTTFKSSEFADLTVNTEQVRFRRLLEAASRYLDKRCERFFYCWEGIRYYDGATRLMDIDDILGITTLKLDEDGDGIYESTMAITDYVLYPLNRYPKSWIEIGNNGDYGSFASGTKKGVEITGVFGYGDGYNATPYVTTGQTVQNNPLAIGDTTLTVTATAAWGAGMTLRIESEQVYIKTVTDGTNVVIRRGVNGTTAAAHILNTPIYSYEYPQMIWQATLMLAMRAWKRKDSAFQDVVGSPETGMLIVYKDEDPDVAKIIDRYRRRV
uniref:Putative head tail connector protein n=1 Tax=viral metagenome TaxID=1070528 RepID=A0A6H1ZQK8_9ZZZZ